jgi:SNF2-related domain
MRLVLDEGHVSAAASNLAKLCQELSVERRWIVSGTPTRNLMGLSLGQSEFAESVDDSPTPDDADEEQLPTIDGELVYPSDGSKDPPRLWTRVDRDDLAKLGEMISKFIGVPQFAYEANLFRKMVAAPLLDRQGPAFGATQVVSQVMSQVMFRHQWVTAHTFSTPLTPPLQNSRRRAGDAR